ncbi:MAG TPA: BamA/TamA family outer membrane protein [Tepidisphaeraceae bacterium]|nr:BamA/TamA family outer membrane protein [Tepidisphaeraceae bacterium]
MWFDVAGAKPAGCHLNLARRIALVVLFAWLAPGFVGAQYIMEDIHNPRRYDPGNMIVPFVFYSPTYHFAGGLAYDGTGLLQPQTDTSFFAWGSEKGSYSIDFSATDYELRPIDRLFLNANAGYRWDKDYTAYISGNPSFRFGPPAGTNDSDKYNFITTQGIDVYGNISLRYLLPIGRGATSLVPHERLENGILTAGGAGGRGWNPLVTGRTFLEFTPFVEDLSLHTPSTDLSEQPGRFHGDENGIRAGILYDNVDFPLNPTSGNLSHFTFTRDFGWFNSSEAFTNLTGEFTQYFNLGRTLLFRQRVVAIDLWTSYSPTWNQHVNGGFRTLEGSPPFYEGATLGGSTRLRAYADNRFWDRAGIYGAAELRLTPVWNPLGDIKLLKFADITWVQWAVFVETGRVAPDYSWKIFDNLKSDAGLGIRILSNNTLVRVDVAVSPEGVGFRAMLSQPF